MAQTTVTVPDGRAALKWSQQRARQPGEVLFRGQGRVYATIKPSMAREDLPDAVQVELWNLCIRFEHTARLGLTGYAIRDAHDRLAVLQHYLMRSPVIDLTGTPEIALHFATLGALPGQQCVVYALDRAVVEARRRDVVVTDHAFLALPVEEGGLAHRWLRQDGYSVGLRDWRNRGALKAFDLLELPGLATCHFTFAAGDRNVIDYLGDLESVDGDPLATKVRGVAKTVALSLRLSPSVDALFANSKTLDPHAALLEEIDALLALTLREGDRDLSAEGERFRQAAVSSCWDLSWEAGLGDWKERVLVRSHDA